MAGSAHAVSSCGATHAAMQRIDLNQHLLMGPQTLWQHPIHPRNRRLMGKQFRAWSWSSGMRRFHG
jgi:hypothetical protein